MIYKALYDYYQRHKSDLPKVGFEECEFKYLIMLEDDGSFVRLESKIVDAKKKNGQFYFVPKSCRRSGKNSWQTTWLLWDHYGYVLRYSKTGKAGQETADLQNKQFVRKIEELPESVKQDAGVHAVLEFYRRGEYEKVKLAPEWKDCARISDCKLSFQLKSDSVSVASRSAVAEYIADQALNKADPDAKTGCCLVTGKHGPIVRLVTPTPIPGAMANPAITSFQTNSGFDSYGKEQCYNAPIGVEAEFMCTTALKSLLSKESRNKFFLGEITAVFWVEKAISSFPFESILSMMSQGDKENQENNVTAMRKLCEAVHAGKIPTDEQRTRFYFLGLSPSAARICIRFWKAGTVGELGEKITQHFDDLSIVNGAEYPSLTSLLASVVREVKKENKKIPPNLPAELFEAAFNGTCYPVTLQNLCLQRIRADRDRNKKKVSMKVSPLRASILKACVNRKSRLYPSSSTTNKEIMMSYDPENPNIAYQCGALFAVLVKTQEEAIPGVNASISDRYFAAASTRPSTVFGTLIRLNRAHLKKLHPGRVVNLERMIAAIIDKIGDRFPAYLPPDEQSRFCIGYYQKRQELFTSKTKTESAGTDNLELIQEN